MIGFLALLVVPVSASEVTGSLCTGINCPVEGTVIAAPTASVAAGTHTSAQSVTLTATGSQSILYTTDGTAPACPSTGTAYSGAVSVSSSATIKTIACYANNASSTVASYAYTISIPATTGNSNAGGGGGGGGGSYVAPTTTTPATTTTPTTATTPTTPTTGAGSALLQQQMQLLNLLIVQLQALLVQAKAQGINLPAGTEALIGALAAPATPSTAGAFTRNLETGMTGNDVKQLQIYLNAKGFKVSASGLGSPGNETSFFGAGTRGALARFQAANGISPAVGYFGPKTMAYVNANP